MMMTVADLEALARFLQALDDASGLDGVSLDAAGTLWMAGEIVGYLDLNVDEDGATVYGYRRKAEG
jgi:hypothetical protein